MSIRAPHALQPRLPQGGVSPFNFALGLADIQRLAKELQDLQATHEKEHQLLLDKIQSDHTQKMVEIDEQIQLASQHITTIKKGNPGEPGISPKPIDERAIENRVFSRIRPPEDGKTPVVDHEAIAQKAAKIALGKIKIPKVENGKNAEPKDIIPILVKFLKDEKPLTMEHITGLKEEVASYRNQLAGKHYGENTSLRGGGDVVTAGSNVTITTDANGKKVISSSGGSGFTELAPTETPNGSTTVFTFAAATAKPGYVVADNVWLKATSKSGTINWTWSAGAKQATLTIPPNDEIYAIV